MKKTTFAAMALLLLTCSVCTAQNNIEPGVDRWSIKTSLAANPRTKSSTLEDLLSLPNPITQLKDTPAVGRIQKTVNGLKEGDIITIQGWLMLVALEDNSNDHNRDGDYHIQIRLTGDWADSCFIVEIPDPDFIEDADLKAKCAAAREFVKTKLLKGNEPGTSGNKMTHPVYVNITGQLFFDAIHLTTGPRGKKGMHSYTCWELHPVTAIAFAPAPQSE